jgi:hypothetical protein
VCAAQGLRNIIEEMMIGRRLVAAVSALAAMNALVLVVRANLGFFLCRRREMPRGGFLMIYPNDSVIV